jgi:PAS domain S-box-containing protein
MRKIISRLVSGLRLRLLLLVLLACAPLVGLTLHTASEERRRLVTEWNQRSQEMMELATREEGRVIGQTRQLLLALAESSAVRSGNRRDCKKLLDELFGNSPRYANLGVVKTNGMVLASARPMVEPANQTNRPFFRRALATRAFAIGDFPDGQAAGQPTVNFGCPVFDSDGQVQAVVFAALDLDWVSSFESALPAQLPKGATWTEIDRTGRILARYPSPEKWVGQPFLEKSLLKTIFSQNHGVVEAMSADGIPGYHAFAAMRSQLVPDDVVTILSSVPKQVLFAEADRRLTENLTGLGIAACFAFMLGWIGSHFLVLRPVRTLVKSSAQLATGDLSTRTGMSHRGDELGQLSHAFDQMAQALEHREVERQSADYALKASEMRYRRLFETAQDGILILNADTGKIDDVNPFLTDLLGYTREQLLGNKLWEIGPFKDTKASQAEFRELQREAYVRYEDLPLETSDGRSINVEFVSNVYQANGDKVVQCNIRDITKRKQAEARLRLQSTALEAAANAIIITDRSGTISWANSAFTRLTGYSTTEVLGANIRLLRSDQHNPAFYRNLWQTILDGRTWHAEIINRRKNGSLYTEDNTITAVRDAHGEITHFVSVKQDITERKQAEVKRKEYSRKLQVLSRRLVEAQETERRNIARELHDEIGQALTVMQLNLQAMLQSPVADGLTPRLNENLKVVERVLEQVHDISLNLRPSMLDDLGLEPALRWYTNRQAALAGLQAEFVTDSLEHRLDPIIETECFRIAQEALTNVVRHAQARTVTVELHTKDGRLHLGVRDDGVGFNVAPVREQAVRGASLGLLSMEERAALAGGGLEFKSTPGQGTDVQAWFPLKWQTPPSKSETP